MSDPVRLSRDADAPAGLRELMRGARGNLPNERQLNRLALGVGAAAGVSLTAKGAAATAAAASAGGATTTAASASGGLLSTKLAGLVIAGAALLGGAGYYVSQTDADVPQLARVGSVPALAAHAKPEPGPTIQPAAPVSAESPGAPVENAAKIKASGPSEAALLAQAQAALKTDPARALTITREHKRRFPKGTLAQEREVIAIEALSRLGSDSDAKSRADQFKSKYPGSAHQEKVDTATDSSGRKP